MPREKQWTMSVKNTISNLNSHLKSYLAKYGVLTFVAIVLIVLSLLVASGEYSKNNADVIIIPTTIFWIIPLAVLAVLFIWWILALVSTHIDRSKGNGTFSLTSLRYACVWLLPLLGVLGYTFAFSELVDKKTTEIIKEASNILVVGGVIGYLSNLSHFFGIFKNELKDIVYFDEYLGNRKDINTIWRKVSKSMIEKKFPNISEDLFTIIEEHYIRKNEYSYYSDYRIVMNIEWGDVNKETIIIRDYIIFDLVTEKRGTVDVSFSAWIITSPEQIEGTDYYSKILYSKVDGKDVNTKEEPTPHKDNIYTSKHVINIDNSKNSDQGEGRSYRIALSRERKLRLTTDYHLSFRAKYIVKDMSISLTLPDGLDATFICRGTPKDFETLKNDKKSKELTYKGLILQRQGFTFALFKEH